MMWKIWRVQKSDILLQESMRHHYSKPRGFVGRQLFYRIYYNDHFHGCIGFGSAVLHLPGRKVDWPLNNGVNNIFYQIWPWNGEKYPLRNFTTKALLEAEKIAKEDYKSWYGDEVKWFESLVELPRTGDLYLKAGYKEIGITQGKTCVRTWGQSTDSWGGRRVWDIGNPKRVFFKTA